MTHVAVVGCGVIGAAVAYELSQVAGLSVTVLDRQPPAQASTGAALGVLMGIISRKTKGNAWRMRQDSLRRYETLLPELEAKTGQAILFNCQGLVQLCFEQEDLIAWKTLAATRLDQGWQLEVWDIAQLQAHCPQVVNVRVCSAIYSPQDRQVDPTALTLALVAAAQQQGVTFHFDRPVTGFKLSDRCCHQVLTSAETLNVDWVVIAAGLGSTPLTQALPQPVELRPVLGQALRVRLAQPLGSAAFQPVITGHDIHIVPLTNRDYWVGATVEFPTEGGTPPVAELDRLQALMQKAIEFCPALAAAEIVDRWSGLRPRPHNRPAPIIEPAPGCDNILLATGHYRNGVLLAPATAQAIRAAIEEGA
jgi:glycine/D-amino acid oxidase-like deaminating enzyme